jgi:plasmid stability protein
VKRIPIGLTDEQHEALRRVSGRRHRSIGALVRDAVDQVYPSEGVPQGELRARARASFGRFHSGSADIAERHDDYLGELDRW